MYDLDLVENLLTLDLSLFAVYARVAPMWKCGQQAHWEGIVVVYVEVCHLTYLPYPTDTNRPSHLSRYD